MKAEVSDLKRKVDELASEVAGKGGELTRVKEEQAEQARLVKRLQRKLQLVTRERDSYKVSTGSYRRNYNVNFVFEIVYGIS
jgi:Mitotic checkpoint protein